MVKLPVYNSLLLYNINFDEVKRIIWQWKIYLSNGYSCMEQVEIDSEDRVRGFLLTRKLLNQGFLLVMLKSSLQKFYSRHHDLVKYYGVLGQKWLWICFICHNHNLFLSSFMTYHQVCSNSNTTSGTGTIYPFGAPELAPICFTWWGLCSSSCQITCLHIFSSVLWCCYDFHVKTMFELCWLPCLL